MELHWHPGGDPSGCGPVFALHRGRTRARNPDGGDHGIADVRSGVVATWHRPVARRDQSASRVARAFAAGLRAAIERGLSMLEGLKIVRGTMRSLRIYYGDRE